MPRYIDADALANYANNQVGGTITANEIMRFPIADVEPVRQRTVTAMARLTDKRFVGDGFYQPKSREERLEIFSHIPHLNDIYNRLAEYEDTGLMPDEIKNMKIYCENTGCMWISTKEKMPENDTSVLICACGHRVTAYYNHLKKAFILTEDEKLYYETAAVSHWMPLPEPPKGE